MEAKLRGILAILAAATTWGFFGLYVRFTQEMGINAYTLFFLGGLTACLNIYLYFWLKREKLQFPKKNEIPALALTGFSGYVTILTVTFAFQQTTIAITEFLHYLAPLFTILIAAILLKERITGWKLIALAISIIGTFLILDLSFANLSLQNKGAIFAIISAIAYGFYIVAGKSIKSLSEMQLIFWAILAGLPFSTAMFLFNNSLPNIWQIAFVYIFSGIFYVPISNYLYFYGLKRLEAGTASILLLFEVVIAVIVGAFFYKEIPSHYALLGGILILGSCALVAVKEKQN